MTWQEKARETIRHAQTVSLHHRFWRTHYWIPVHECACGNQYFPVIAGQAKCCQCDPSAAACLRKREAA